MCNKADYFTRHTPELTLSNTGRLFVSENFDVEIDVCADGKNAFGPVYISRENNFLLVPNDSICSTKNVFMFPPGNSFY